MTDVKIYIIVILRKKKRSFILVIEVMKKKPVKLSAAYMFPIRTKYLLPLYMVPQKREWIIERTITAINILYKSAIDGVTLLINIENCL